MAKRKNPAAVALGRLGGRVTSPAKAASSKRNGKRYGGRKPKFAVGDRTTVNMQAPVDYRLRVGSIKEVGPGKSEYYVTFADGEKPAYGHLMSWWLDRDE